MKLEVEDEDREERGGSSRQHVRREGKSCLTLFSFQMNE